MKFYEQKFEHDCDSCQWVGHRDECDWWYCPGTTFDGSMIKRFGDEGSEYSSIAVGIYVSCIARGDKLLWKWDKLFQEVCEKFLGKGYCEKAFKVRHENTWSKINRYLKDSFSDGDRHCKAFYLDREKDWVLSIAVGGLSDSTRKFHWFKDSKYPLSSYEDFDISIRINEEHVAPENYPEGLSEKLRKITPLLGFEGRGSYIPWEDVYETIRWQECV